MATLRQRLRMQAEDGTYNTVHLETAADHVLMPDGTKLSDKLLSMKTTIDGLSVSSGMSHSLGDVFTWAGHTWRTVHLTGDLEYAILHTGTEKVQFGFSNVYAGSTIANKCEEFLATFSEDEQSLLAPITVNGVTCKVFIPSKEQLDGIFAWFINASRLAYTVFPDLTQTFEKMSNGYWWTSTPSNDSVYYVNGDGLIRENNPAATNVRFRPCIAFKRLEVAAAWQL